MQNESHPVPGADPVIAEPAPPPPLPEAAPSKKLLAPVWHTVLIVLLVVGNSFVTAFFTSHKTQDLHSVTEKARIAQYIGTIVLEFFLLAVVWVGLRLRKTTIRELIGGRWATPEDFLMDVAVAFVFWLVAAGILAGLGYLLGLAKSGQIGRASCRERV